MTANADTPRPGNYDITVTMEIPGFGGTRTQQMQQCITEDHFNDNPEAFLSQLKDQDECEVVDYDFGDGEMTIHMQCSTDQGDATFKGQGTYTEDSYQMTQKMTISGVEMNGAEMEITTQVVGKWSGDC